MTADGSWGQPESLFDAVVAGGGLSGLATAFEIARRVPDARILCLEARGGLVLLLPVDESVAMLQSPETRRAVLALARTHGFTHVAIELPKDRRGAGGRGTDAPLLRD